MAPTLARAACSARPTPWAAWPFQPSVRSLSTLETDRVDPRRRAPLQRVTGMVGVTAKRAFRRTPGAADCSEELAATHQTARRIERAAFEVELIHCPGCAPLEAGDRKVARARLRVGTSGRTTRAAAVDRVADPVRCGVDPHAADSNALDDVAVRKAEHANERFTGIARNIER